MAVWAKCLSAFNEGNHDEAVLLLPSIAEPNSLRIDVDIKTSAFGISHVKANLLHLSSKNGWLDVMKSLVNDYNFDLKARDDKGNTCLHYAVAGNHLNIVKYLVKHNSDPTATNKREVAVLHCAATNGSLDVMKYLINHCNCNPLATNRHGKNTFHFSMMHIDVVQYLINDCHCDPMATDNDNRTSLHYAAWGGAPDVLKYLIDECNCDPMSVDVNGRTALHCAVTTDYGSSFKAIECLLSHKCDPFAKDNHGYIPLKLSRKKYIPVLYKYMCLFAFNKTNYKEALRLLPLVQGLDSLIIEVTLKTTPLREHVGIYQVQANLLHLSSRNGWLDIIKLLITKYHFNPSVRNDKGHICLHFAAAGNQVEVVRYIVTEYNCDPMTESLECQDTAIHCAATNGSFDVIKYLINHCHCDPKASNLLGQTSLHCAVRHIDIVKYLINECSCNPLATDFLNEQTILHYAARKGFVNVLKYLVNECHCDPMRKDKSGRTALHCAVDSSHPEAVEYLLSNGRCDPLAKDNEGLTSIELVKGDKKLVQLFKAFGRMKASHPVDSYVNVLIVGNPGAGKSTLGRVIVDTATGSIAFGSFRNVKKVEPCTAGIIPTKMQHFTLGNVILHDFAGHSEYYTSHSTVIDNLLQGSGCVFLIVVNLLEMEAAKHLHQWLTVVRNQAQKVLNHCHAIVVISHMDEIHHVSLAEGKGREKEILMICSMENCDGIVLDCRKLGGNSLDVFLDKLACACESVRSTSGKNLSLYCHMMYGLLEESKANVLTLPEVMLAAKNNNHYLLPDEKDEVLDVLSSLASTGLIILLKGQDKVWIVVNKLILLAEVNGILFAPKTFKQHVKIASNTGIVKVSDLISLFPDYDHEMLISFLQSMELCKEIHPSFLAMTNLSLLKEIDLEGVERFLFLPCLLYSEKPDEMLNSQKYQFGWCLQCTRDQDFFPPRYFHVLSLHLAYKLALPQEDGNLNRYCTFWRNGIHWFNGHGVGATVEIVDENQCVMIMMSCEEGYSHNMVSLRRKVIGEVVRLHKESCSTLEVKEFLIDPKELVYPMNKSKEMAKYSVHALLLAIAEGRPFIVTNKGQRELTRILTDESLSDINMSLLGGRNIKVRLNF